MNCPVKALVLIGRRNFSDMLIGKTIVKYELMLVLFFSEMSCTWPRNGYAATCPPSARAICLNGKLDAAMSAMAADQAHMPEIGKLHIKASGAEAIENQLGDGYVDFPRPPQRTGGDDLWWPHRNGTQLTGHLCVKTANVTQISTFLRNSGLIFKSLNAGGRFALPPREHPLNIWQPSMISGHRAIPGSA